MTERRRFAPIAQFCTRRGSCCHAPLGIQNGGYLRAAAEALVGGQGSADGEDALTSCLPVR